MNYYINKTVSLGMEAATEIATAELKKEGFGVVTQFDVDKALKEKLNVKFRPYRILGVCNPPFALKSINAEDKIGTIIPCNVMLQTRDQNTEIAMVNPVAMVQEIDNEAMKEIAEEILERLQRVLDNI